MNTKMLSTDSEYSTTYPVRNSSATCQAAASASKPGIAASRGSCGNAQSA